MIRSEFEETQLKRSIIKNSSPIDVVITWVNGNDPVWLKEREHYAKIAREDGNSSFRFRDWDNLNYWFRGIEQFAPWVNKIFFVTYGHVPKWLDTSNPKLQIVKHADFIPAEYLPTFNSNVIEFYFHRIKGLSERFVYFNDDMFLLNHVEPTRFFKDGLPCDIGGMTVNIHSGMFGSSVLLSRTLLNEHFDKQTVIRQDPSKWFNIRYVSASLLNALCLHIRKKEFIGFVNPHLPQGYLKKTYEEVWVNCSEDILRTSHSKFRDYGDLAPWLIRYWQLASNKFSPYNPFKDGNYFLVEDNNVAEIANCIQQQKRKMICINDSERISNFESARHKINAAFESILPKKCSFELF